MSPTYFSKSKIYLEFFEMVFEIFRYNSRNFPKYFLKISKLFLEMILRNFSKCFSKVSEVFLEISEIFLENVEMIFKIFRNISQNFPKYFWNCYELILKILRNNLSKFFETFLKFFKIILKISVVFLIASRNISRSFQTSKSSETFEMIFEISD